VTPYFSGGGITIYHADCLNVLPELSGVGAVVTDPPYSSGGAFRGDRTNSVIQKYITSDAAPTAEYAREFAGDTRDQRAFAAWCAMWLNAARYASEPGAIVTSFTDWRQLPTMTDAVQAGGWIWRGIATWHKPGIRMQRGRFSSSAEYVVWGTNGPWVDHDGAPQNVFTCAPVRDKEHIAQKPDAVVAWVLQSVPPAALILDPFMGSGATLRAAKRSGRQAVGIDCDERYCEMAARSLSQSALPLELGA
jgi:site-specific DNA-methyltransferase (adenine-specific)